MRFGQQDASQTLRRLLQVPERIQGLGLLGCGENDAVSPAAANGEKAVTAALDEWNPSPEFLPLL